MRCYIHRRDFLLGAAALSIAGAMLPACSRRAEVAGLPALRVSTVGKGEADIRLLQDVAHIQADTFRIEYSNFASGQLVIEALNGRALDFGNMSEIQVVLVPRGSACRAHCLPAERRRRVCQAGAHPEPVDVRPLWDDRYNDIISEKV